VTCEPKIVVWSEFRGNEEGTIPPEGGYKLERTVKGGAVLVGGWGLRINIRDNGQLIKLQTEREGFSETTHCSDKAANKKRGEKERGAEWGRSR